MAKATSHQDTANSDTLYLAFELSRANWKLGFSIGLGQRPRVRNVPAGDEERLLSEIAAAKRRFGLPAGARVCSCYEAGRDGFWIHRFLQALGIENVVIDAASLEVARRRKRAKTDRIDVAKLLRLLIRYHLGEHKVWSVVRVPSVEAEDHRQLQREIDTLTRERTRHVNRIRGLLMTVGVREIKFNKRFLEQLDGLRLWDGSRLPPALHGRLIREWERIERVDEQRKELRQERKAILEHWQSKEADQIRRLASLRGIGVGSAWLFVMEMFAWRELKNRRQVGALAGLAPTPFASGDLQREQGISKAGNKLVRRRIVELAWCWLHYQPQSTLARWFAQRFANAGRRMRRVGIIALARKLLVALWRYADRGIVPEGAVVVAA